MVNKAALLLAFAIGAVVLATGLAKHPLQAAESGDRSPQIGYASVLAVSPNSFASALPKSNRTRPVTTKTGATLPIPVAAVLNSGVLIVISNASQEMFVFKDGVPWGSSPVSTGKRGKETPTGVFPILQKRRHHRSNLYSNAPMPYMQRLTWDGIAIHQGRLPGYPASHGCIRLPRDFARGLFGLTGRSTTTVVVTDYALGSSQQARLLATLMPMPSAGQRGHLLQGAEPALAGLETSPDGAGTALIAAQHSLDPVKPSSKPRMAGAAARGREQTIQLAAAPTIAEANAYWARISKRFPELARYEKRIVPATVNAQKFFRLRVRGPGAKESCASLRRSGAECFLVG